MATAAAPATQNTVGALRAARDAEPSPTTTQRLLLFLAPVPHVPGVARECISQRGSSPTHGNISPCIRSALDYAVY